jgi:hypothetical protein
MKTAIHITYILDAWASVTSTEIAVIRIVDVMCYTLAAIFGLVGVFKIYRKWQHDHHIFSNVTGEISSWFLGSIFFIVAHGIIALMWGGYVSFF